MKLKFEDYKKKKQLDRIEYLLLKKEKEFTFYTILILNSMVWFAIAFLTLGMLFYLTFNIFAILKLYLIIFPLMKTIVICVFIIDIFRYLYHREKVKVIDKFLFKKKK